MTFGSSLVSELERLANALKEEPAESAQVSLPAVADRVARNLGVRADEIAILALSTRWRHLYFLVPEALRRAGYIPLSNTSAIAARTVRENRPEIINNFQAVRHLTVSEGAKLDSAASIIIQNTIQKMITAPMLSDGRIVGVIQVSRKGADLATCGPDFTPDDLGKVLALCRPLGKLIQYVTRE